MDVGGEDRPPEAHASFISRAWSRFWRTALRTLAALVLAQLVMAASLHVWSRAAYVLIPLLYSSQFTRDTMALAAPLAARSVAFGCLALCLMPLLLAAWSFRHSLARRALAAFGGFLGGALAALAGQTAISLYTGYAFTLRHAVPNPATLLDWACLGLACLFGLWTAFQAVPFRFR